MKTNYRRFTVAGLMVLALGAGALALLLRSDGAGRSIETTAGPLRVAARFEPDPPKPGKNTLEVTLSDREGSPVAGATLEARAIMPAMGSMPEMRAGGTASELGKGRYELPLELSMAGPWPLSLRIHTPDGSEVELEFDYKTGVPVSLASGPTPRASSDTDVAYHTCSMHPSVRSSTPGTCPICSMGLVPVSQAELETGTIRLDEGQRQLIGVKTGTVERKAAELPIRAVGRVAYDETRLTDITLKFRGWVGEVFADSTGAPVEKGEPLFTVYAPELLSAQEEYLESIRRSRSDAHAPGGLRASARQRLLLWNMSEAQISELARSGKPSIYVPIYSPVSGIVIQKNVVDGSAIEPGGLLYRIADLSRVWVEADLYEADLPLVKLGDAARVSLPYLPGETFTGTIDYIYPYLDASTRTGRVRLIAPNEGGRLKPDMYADVDISVPLGERLIVPEGAVIRAGKTNLVFVDLGEGSLEPRKIELGRRTPEGYVVASGLEPGEIVVTSGNFLIAAESKLKSGVEKW